MYVVKFGNDYYRRKSRNGKDYSIDNAHIFNKLASARACVTNLKKRKTRNSKNFRDGEWASIEGGTSPVAAVRVACIKA